MTAFYEDFHSKIWMTYRRGFEPFEGTKVTSDCGWGCMLRAAQMLFGNTLILQQLGRRWRANKSSRSDEKVRIIH